MPIFKNENVKQNTLFIYILKMKVKAKTYEINFSKFQL
jgi:hypothetical protein